MRPAIHKEQAYKKMMEQNDRILSGREIEATSSQHFRRYLDELIPTGEHIEGPSPVKFESIKQSGFSGEFAVDS